MSKKVISILLSAALLVAMLCVGAIVGFADDTATYYFLAPDEYFATNNDVGFYYWAPSENAPWPGQPMTPAPEIGENVFKCETPSMDSTSTIIFNAFVDAGTPADPELAAVAHQTININTEGYEEGESEVYDALGMELDDFNGMIYVLDNNNKTVNDFSGAATTVGEWFSIDPSAPNYYKNFEQYYGTYNFAVEPDTEVATDSDTPEQKDVIAGEEIEVTLYIQNAPHLVGFNSYIYWNTDQFEYVSNEMIATGELTIPNADFVSSGRFNNLTTLNIRSLCEDFAGDAAPAFKVTLKAVKDLNKDEIDIYRLTESLTWYNSSDLPFYDPNLPSPRSIYYVDNPDLDKELIAADENTFIKLELPERDTDTTTDIVTDTDTVTDSDTDTTTDTVTDTDTATDVVSDTDTTTDTESDTDSVETPDEPSDTDTESDTDSVETPDEPSDTDTSDTDTDTATDTDTVTDTDTATDTDTSDTDTNSSSSSSSSSSSTSSRTISTTSRTTTTTTTTTNNGTASTVQTAGTVAVVALLVVLMAAASVMIYTRKKTDE